MPGRLMTRHVPETDLSLLARIVLDLTTSRRQSRSVRAHGHGEHRTSMGEGRTKRAVRLHVRKNDATHRQRSAARRQGLAVRAEGHARELAGTVEVRPKKGVGEEGVDQAAS